MNDKVCINIVENDEIVETITMHQDDTDYYTGIDKLGRVVEFWGPNADVGMRLPSATKQ